MSHSAERPDGEGDNRSLRKRSWSRLAGLWPTGQTPWQNVWLAAVAAAVLVAAHR